MTPYNGDKITILKDLRKEKREWKENTFSAQDLKKAGFTKEEIEKLHGEVRYKEKRYNKEYIRGYFKGKISNPNTKDTPKANSFPKISYPPEVKSKMDRIAQEMLKSLNSQK